MPKVTPAKPDPGLAGTDPSGLEEADDAGTRPDPRDSGRDDGDTGDTHLHPPAPDPLVTNLPAPKPAPKPEPARDPVDVIMGGVPYDDSYGYKSPATAEAIAKGWYTYFNGRGGNARLHPGIDLIAPKGTPQYAPVAGTIVCAGTGVGPGAWGTGCLAFPDLDAGGGRVEFVTDADPNVSVVFGHMDRATAKVGQHVEAGQQIGVIGDWRHNHLETRRRRGQTSEYDITEPRATLRPLMTGTTPAPDPDVLPGVTTADLVKWFESVGGFSYHPGGPVSALWREDGEATGTWPPIAEVYERRDKVRVFRFVGGRTYLAKGSRVWRAKKED